MTTEQVTNETLQRLILNSKYLRESSSNKQKDVCSLSSIIDMAMSQSDCIKIGVGCEKIISDLILDTTHLVDIKQANKKGKKETDHLFMDKDKKIVYYAELKSNLNLDTEKSKSTYSKCLDIVEILKTEYPDHEIKWCLLGLRHLDYDKIPKTVAKKYSEIQPNVFGIHQYMEMLGINLTFTEETYKQFINDIAKTMFA